MEHLDTEFRRAEAIHLHDQLVVITADAYTYGTDSGWTLCDEPEYLINLPSDAVTELLALINGSYKSGTQRFTGALGIARHYQEYPQEDVKLLILEVRIVSDRMIEVRMVMEGKAGDQWQEHWTYAGAYTITWANDWQEP